MSDSTLSIFEGHDYLNLKTRKKNGNTVPTPVWFVKDGDTLYVTTRAQAGKLKRVRNFSDVEIAPCDVKGGLLGDWMPAEAHEVTEADTRQRAHDLFTEKYGHTDMWKNIEPAQSPNRAFIAVTAPHTS